MRFTPGKYANITSTFALLVALGGTGYAAATLPKGSVGTKQLKPEAVTSVKVKNGTLTKDDFGAGQLPAGPAGPAGPRGPSDGFSVFKNGPVNLGGAFANQATLPLPAGNYLIWGKGQVTNDAGAGDTEARCQLVSPVGDSDSTLVGLMDKNVPGSAESGTMVVTIATRLTAAGNVLLQCRNEGGGVTQMSNIKVSAVQVGSLSNTPSS